MAIRSLALGIRLIHVFADVQLKIRQLQYNTTRLFGQWNDLFINQVSDVTSSIPFYNFFQNSLPKSFQFILLIFITLQK